MKQIERLFRACLIGVLLAVGTQASTALANDIQGEYLADSVEISVLTCSPHNEVYSLYGHSAIRYKNLKTGEDIAFSYGIFSFKKPFFVLRFALGKTDYEMGAIPFAAFCNEYRRVGSMVVEQIINLTPSEKERLIGALKENYKPENRVYRYNFFYDNCATRVRDMIVKNIDGKVMYAGMNGTADYTWRNIIHDYTDGHPWAAYGNDLCLGVKADRPTTQADRQFIPDYLMLDFSRAQIYSDGEYRPLVKDVNTIVNAGVTFVDEHTVFTPLLCSLVFLALSIGIAVVEYRRKKTFVAWDALLMIVVGVAGLTLTVLLCSEHPTTSTNLQYLLINPLPLFFIHKVMRRRQTRYWTISALLIVLMLIGGLAQDYAEGMSIVALSLLIRNYMHLKKGIK